MAFVKTKLGNEEIKEYLAGIEFKNSAKTKNI
jgi:hypothetical protein